MLPMALRPALLAAWPLAAAFVAAPRLGPRSAANAVLMLAIAAWAVLGSRRDTPWFRSRYLWIPRWAGPAYLAAMAAAGALAYADFSNADWGDIAYYLSSFRNAQGWVPGANVYDGLPFLAHHSEFACLPVAWLFRLHPGPLFPLLAQAGAALAAWHLFRRWLLRRIADAAVAEWLAFAFALSPCLTAPLQRGFHGAALAAPFLVLAATAFHDRAWRRFLWALFALLLVKEVFALTALSFGAIALAQRRPAKWIGVPIAVGLAWGLFLKFAFFPWMLGGAGYYYASLFGDGKSAVASLASAGTVRYLLLLALWGGAARAWKSPYVLAALPPAALNAMLDGFASPWAHYIIEPSFWFFFAGALSLSAPEENRPAPTDARDVRDQPPRTAIRTRRGPLLSFVATLAFMSFLSRQGLSWRQHPLAGSYRALLAHIPADATVAMGVPLEDRFWTMKAVYSVKGVKAPWAPYTGEQACRMGVYAALQKTFPVQGGPAGFLPEEQDRIRACADALRADPDWVLAWEDGDIGLFRRREEGAGDAPAP